MKLVTNFFRRNIARLVAVGLLIGFYLLAQLPSLSTAERNNLATRFRFKRSSLYAVPGSSYRSHRIVNPSLKRIESWISATGASVAINDLDGDGLPNDICHVDPRTDQVTVAPAPGTPLRYEPFALDAGRLFDGATMAPMGCLPGDVNEDGLMDIVVTYWGRTPIAFLARKSDKAKQPLSNNSYKPVEIVGGGQRWFTGAATLADLDGDGHLDLVIGNYFKDGARILDAHDNTQIGRAHV